MERRELVQPEALRMLRVSDQEDLDRGLGPAGLADPEEDRALLEILSPLLAHAEDGLRLELEHAGTIAVAADFVDPDRILHEFQARSAALATAAAFRRPGPGLPASGRAAIVARIVGFMVSHGSAVSPIFGTPSVTYGSRRSVTCSHGRSGTAQTSSLPVAHPASDVVHAGQAVPLGGFPSA